MAASKKKKSKTKSKIKSKPKKKATQKKSAKKKTSKKVAKKATKKKATKKKVAKKNVTQKKATQKKATQKKVAPKTTKKANKKTVTKAMMMAQVEFVPLDNRVLIQRQGVSEMTAGGLYIPQIVEQGRPNKGFVLSVGRGHRDEKGRLKPMDVKIGDEVLFAEYSGESLTINDQELLLVREEDILGVVS